MEEESFETLAAFLDGDDVDSNHVAALLARPEGQAALLDFAMLKAAIRQDSARPRQTFVPETERRMAAAGVMWRRTVSRRRLAAAAALLAATVGAFWLGSSGFRATRQDGPPVSTRVERFERGVDWTTGPFEEAR